MSDSNETRKKIRKPRRWARWLATFGFGFFCVIVTELFAVYHYQETQATLLFIVESCLALIVGIIGFLLVFIGVRVYSFEAKLDETTSLLDEVSRKTRWSVNLCKYLIEKIAGISKEIGSFIGEVTKVIENFQKLITTSEESGKKIERLTQAITQNTERLNRAQDDLSASSFGMLRASVLLMNILGERELELEKTKGKITPGIILSPVADDVTSWLESIKQAKNDSVKAVLTKIAESYFYEETFDIRNKRIVTNSRNWTIFLYKAVKAMINYVETMDGDQVLHYYTVTPFDPYDALNCPDKESVIKDSKGKKSKITFCYEVPFLGDYFSTFIRELVTSYASVVRHRRYILCYKDVTLLNEYPDKQRWKMSNEKLCELAKQDSVLDIPISKDCEINHEWFKKMKLAKTDDEYGEWQHIELEQFVDKFKQASGERLFRPVFKKEGSHLNETDPKQLIEKTLTRINELIEKKKEELEKEKIVESEHWSKFAAILPDIDELESSKAKEFLNILDISQKILSSKEAAGTRKSFKKLVDLMKQKRSIVQYQMYCKDKGTYIHSLISYFTENFHSSKEDAHFVPLVGPHANEWDAKYEYIPPEFAMFGIGARNALIKDINWLLVLTSSIEFPWHSSEIEFLFHKDDKTKDKYMTGYIDFIKFLDEIH